MKNQKKCSKSWVAILVTLSIFISVGTYAQNAKVIEMKGTDQMRFTVENIEAAPGEKITVKLSNDSKFPAAAMSHNFVLLTKSTDAKAFDKAGAKYKDNEYISPNMIDQIIAKTKMAAGGETVQVTFNAPKKPGKYLYICTFPGHFLSGMKGTLTVK